MHFRPKTLVGGQLKGGRFVAGELTWFEDALVEDVDFSAVRFEDFAALGTRFVRCDFSRATFGDGSGLGGIAKQTVYVDCRFDRANLRLLWDLGNVRFERCSFDRARIHDWWGDAAEFIDCHFAGRLTECRFSGRPSGDIGTPGRASARARNEFHGNDFRSAELVGCSFVNGIDLSSNELPEGPRYIRLDRFLDRVDRVRPIVERWPEGTARKIALGFLARAHERYAEQEEVFFDRDLFPAAYREAAEEMWRLLEAA